MKMKSLMILFIFILSGCDTYKGQIKHDPNHHDNNSTKQKPKDS